MCSYTCIIVIGGSHVFFSVIIFSKLSNADEKKNSTVFAIT